jgi:Ca2+:H+ antiporter
MQSLVVWALAEISHSYVCSRFYLHDPPGEDNLFMPHPEIPPEALRKERELAEAKPEVNPWACITLLAITVALVGVTAEFVGSHLLSPPVNRS